MLISDFAICLGVRSFKDNLKIIDVFSREGGKFSALLRVGKKTTPPTPLSLLKIECFKKEFGMATVKNLEVVQSNSGATLSPVAATTSLFIAELIYKTLPEHYVNGRVYELLFEAAEDIKQNPNSPLTAIKSLLLFLKELGVLSSAEDLHQYETLSVQLQQFISSTIEKRDFEQILTSIEKKTIMNFCLKHLRIHFQTKIDINSLEYFHIVFQMQ